MNKISVFGIICCFLCLRGFAQVHLMPVAPVDIAATLNETTSLIFPAAITTADWGSNGIIVQQVKATKNILHVKAARNNFLPTNLSVVTSDGQFYAFAVRYEPSPEQLNYLVKKDTLAGPALLPVNTRTLRQEGDRIISMPSFLHLSTSVLLTTLQLSGVYVGEHAMWLKLHMVNRSWVNFPIGYVRFFLKDRRIIKRRVVQEKEMVPIYAESPIQIKGREKADMVYGFAPFTVPKSQRLVVQVGEKGEGRFVELKVRGRKILRARKINHR